jgi:cytochrome c peroxidase
MRRHLITITFICSVLLFIANLIGSCKKNEFLHGLTPQGFVIPNSFPRPPYLFDDNPITEEGFQLGKKLFYDTLLSDDHEISCGSCHQQIAGFGTYQHDRSHGVHHSHTQRNAPVLFNLAWYPYFHWDGEYRKLTDEFSQPLLGHVEMGMDFARIMEYLETNNDYKQRFTNVFRIKKISPEFVMKALAQFVGSFVSCNSRYDRYMKNEINFTAQEIRGLTLFTDKCASCHKPPLFTDFSFRNNGISYDTALKDIGRMRLTGSSQDSMTFRVPTLRNCYISSNYMHDGRYGTLHQVIDFYRRDMVRRPSLDPLLKNGVSLSDAQATDLFEFLRTLTDTSFLNDIRFRE